MCLASLCALLLTPVAGWAANDDDSDGRGRFVGTWFCDTVVVAPGAPLAGTQLLLTAEARGTVTSTGTDDLTGLIPGGPFVVQTAAAGGWKRSGRGSFAVNYLQFGFTGTGPGAGLLAFLTRFRCALRVAGRQAEGACDVDLYFGSDTNGDALPDSPNPAVAAPDVVIPDINTISCTRIPVVEKAAS